MDNRFYRSQAGPLRGKHTPGPWTARQCEKPDNCGGIDYAIVDDSQQIIAQTYQRVGWGDAGLYEERPAEANALLIAAAPGLLETVRRAPFRVAVGFVAGLLLGWLSMFCFTLWYFKG
jgi:hypothetical protein